MPTISVNLPEDAISYMRRSVSEGRFADENEFLYEAVRQMDGRDYEVKIQELRDALAEGIRQAKAGIHSPYSLEDLERDMERRK